MITLSLTPAEHAFLLLKLGRGTGSTIRPGESLSAEEVLRFTEKVDVAEPAEPVAWRVKDWADGWILYDDEKRAVDESEAMGGALVQPLYATT